VNRSAEFDLQILHHSPAPGENCRGWSPPQRKMTTKNAQIFKKLPLSQTDGDGDHLAFAALTAI
jgi:hypothetical protein